MATRIARNHFHQRIGLRINDRDRPGQGIASDHELPVWAHRSLNRQSADRTGNRARQRVIIAVQQESDVLDLLSGLLPITRGRRPIRPAHHRRIMAQIV